MRVNPFDGDNGSFIVAVDDGAQHSLWPVFAEFPAGRRVAYAEADRAACLDWIEQNWTRYPAAEAGTGPGFDT